jgi:MFS superfamily sulfate permease-like transporter
MSTIRQQKVPLTGLAGLKQNWRNDLTAAISVALVALPLALGIAVASGVPPISGLLSCIIGGLVTTFFRSSYLTINGPAAGLITVVLGAMTILNDGTNQTLNYVLAAIVISGAFQVTFGFFKLGRLAEMFPSAVIHGMLAGIGILIIASQAHVAIGTSSDAENALGSLLDFIIMLPQANPFILVISILGLLLMLFHSRISYKLFHWLPAPIWVLAIAILLSYLIGFKNAREIPFLGNSYPVGPQYLISIPDNLLDAIVFPNFSKVGTLNFWIAVISITLVSSVETLAITRAIDKLDPYKRKTNLDKDLVAVGFSTMTAGLLGGLPIIAVPVRSTVNVLNDAKTKWSNFHHGALLVIFVLLASPLMQMIPLAALATILVVAGFRLASPRVFRETYEQGVEQLLFLVSTMLITLYSNLLWGIFGGISITLAVHILLARVPIATFFQLVFNSGTRLYFKDNDSVELKVKGIANFLSILSLERILDKIPDGKDLKINLSTAKLVDLTVQEHLNEFKRIHQLTGAKVNMTGMEHHVASSAHRFALKTLLTPVRPRLSPRQKRLKQLAIDNGWRYTDRADWNTSYLQNFKFFDSRPIEFKTNLIAGEYPNNKIKWESSDITFDEGALLAREVYRTTVEVIYLPNSIPKFVMEQEEMFDKVFTRVLPFSPHQDINFREYPRFSSKFVLQGDDREAIRAFLTPELIRFLESEEIYHIESNGEALLVFRSLRVARSKDIEQMVRFSEQLVDKILTPVA